MAKKYPTEWNLSLLYKSPKDPAIEKDMREIELQASSFRKKYAAKTDWLNDERRLAKALAEYERVFALVSGSKPGLYFWLQKQIDTQNNAAEASLNKYFERLTKAGNELLFFELALGTLERTVQRAYLKSDVLKESQYFLERLFKRSKYNLSEKEERILALKAMPSHALWTQGVRKLISKQTVRLKDRDIPFEEALLGAIQNPRTAERRAQYAACMQVLKNASDFAESELNAVVIDKKIDDELRGFAAPYDATILNYENDRSSVLALVDTVTKHFKIAHRFYEVKRKLLGLGVLTQADRAAEIGKNSKKITFENAYATVKKSFDAAHPRYGEILEEMRHNGQLDIYPRRGKVGGAFQMSEIGVPSYILLNQMDDFRSLTTFAHEMGHAIHSERSKQNRPLYQHYTISTAETASTFFEGLVFDDIFATLSEKEKIVALHDKIQDSVATIFRQIAFFNYEKDLHARIRTEGALSKEEMATLFNEHVAAYMGPKVRHEEDDGYFFVHVSHFRSFFYVYSYAYGELISKALLRIYRQDPAFVEKIDQFLSAGGSASPEAIFTSIGIDVKDPNFFRTGLKTIEDDVSTLEKLVAKTKR
jgi:oligoendopeptidase F